MARSRATVEEPKGLVFAADFLTPPEEQAVLDVLDALEFREVVMRGEAARRTVRHFGFDYDYEGWVLEPAEPLPEALLWLRDRCAALAELDPDALAQALVSRYAEGAGIGWHRDAPMFGAKVVGVSLLSSCRMRFQRGKGAERRVFDLDLPPRSAYVLAGPARSAWQHSIPPTKSLRYSITFRTLKNPARWSASRSPT